MALGEQPQRAFIALSYLGHQRLVAEILGQHHSHSIATQQGGMP
jgi:hypothetical protein